MIYVWPRIHIYYTSISEKDRNGLPNILGYETEDYFIPKIPKMFAKWQSNDNH